MEMALYQYMKQHLKIPLLYKLLLYLPSRSILEYSLNILG